MQTNRQPTKTNNYFDPERIRALEHTTSDKIDDLTIALGTNLKKARKFYVGKCPVHGGDNPTAFNLFHSGTTTVGNWRCLTHHCERHFKPTIVGLVRGVLSHSRHKWTSPKNEGEASFQDAIRFLLKFNGDCEIDDIEVNYEEIEQKRFTHQISRFFDEGEKKCLHIDPTVYRQSVSMPCIYSTLRGYDKQVLARYEVGFCGDLKKQMGGRSVAPIYDENHEYIIGCTGRSIFDQCPECLAYHNPADVCPNESYRWQHSKWRNNKGFPREQFLYNYWFSKPYIEQSKIAILVESPGNVWRLEGAGIHNSVGILGTAFTEQQRKIIDKSGALAVIIAMDNGSAGQGAARIIKEQLENLYNVHLLDVGLNDIGESDPDTIHKLFDPVISKVMRQLNYD